MWFERLDKKQFTLYSIQEARLNTAYWLAALINYKSETLDETPITMSEIEAFVRQIKLVLKETYRDLPLQEGIGKQLIKLQFRYVGFFSNHFSKNIRKRFLYNCLGKEMPGDDQIVKEEMLFIKRKNELNLDEYSSAECLNEKWDRAIYMTYDALNLRTKASASWTTEAKTLPGIRQRMSAAKLIMSPSHQNIVDYCNRFVSHMQIGQMESMLLLEQMESDITEQFRSGLALVETTSPLVETNIYNPANGSVNPQHHKIVRQYEQTINSVQETLIMANLARTNSFRRIVDSQTIGQT